MCVDHHKLNVQMNKDPFSLPFLDFVLNLVVRHEMYYLIMDGYIVDIIKLNYLKRRKKQHSS